MVGAISQAARNAKKGAFDGTSSELQKFLHLPPSHSFHFTPRDSSHNNNNTSASPGAEEGISL